jgi:beta-lactamase regulating signal transducer with metallopeptidase domain
MMYLQGITEVVAERALNSIPAGLLIASLAWVGLKTFSKQGSRVRFAVWFLTLLGIAAIPFVPSIEAATGTSAPLHARITIPAVWADAIFGLWVSLAALLGVRLATGVCKLWSLKREATPMELSDLPMEAQRAIVEFRSGRSVEICTSKLVRVPTAVGFFRPTVLLPEWALTDLSEQDLTSVILHELAHLHRLDDWTNLAQKLLGAVFFFHPAVWWVERRLTLEREMACDEVVLATIGNRRAYAECLVSLAEKTFARRSLALAQSVIGHAKSTALRLARILDPSQSSAPRAYTRAIAFASAAVVLCVVIAPGTPQLIAFQDVVTAKAEKAEVRAAAVEIARAEPAVPKPVKVEAIFRPEKQTKAATRVGAEHRNAGQADSVMATRQKPGTELLARETKADSLPYDRTEFVVILQTRVDDDGAMKTSFCVWKVTFRQADNRAIRAQIVTSSL